MRALKRFIGVGTLMMLLGLTSWANAGTEGQILNGMLGRLDLWLGTWQIEATWAGGATLWSQAEYRPMLDGAFIDSVYFVSDNGGELYQRYRSFLATGDEADQVIAHTLNQTGAYAPTVLSITGGGVGMVSSTVWSSGTTEIKERLELTTRDTMSWQVWTQAEGSDDWTQIMDGVWRRVAAKAINLPSPTDVDDSLAPLRPFLGGWEASLNRPDRSRSWVRNEVRPVLSGRVIELRGWELADDRYQQSSTLLYRHPETGEVGSITLLENGSVIPVSVTFSGEPGQELIERLIPGGAFGGRQLRQRIQSLSADSFRLELSVRVADGDAWQQLQESTWYRQEPAASVRAYPVDNKRFVAAGAEQRSFSKEVVINAAIETVYAAWTTAEGWSAVYPQPSQARIELGIGGRYEWLFDGSIGCNGCQVLSYLPNRMLSFSWNAPPSQPATRLQRTWVVVECLPEAADRTRVRLTHLGFGQDEDWDTTYAYFEQAWDRVLPRMQSVLGQVDP